MEVDEADSLRSRTPSEFEFDPETKANTKYNTGIKRSEQRVIKEPGSLWPQLLEQETQSEEPVPVGKEMALEEEPAQPTSFMDDLWELQEVFAATTLTSASGNTVEPPTKTKALVNIMDDDDVYSLPSGYQGRACAVNEYPALNHPASESNNPYLNCYRPSAHSENLGPTAEDFFIEPSMTETEAEKRAAPESAEKEKERREERKKEKIEKKMPWKKEDPDLLLD